MNINYTQRQSDLVNMHGQGVVEDSHGYVHWKEWKEVLPLGIHHLMEPLGNAL